MPEDQRQIRKWIWTLPHSPPPKQLRVHNELKREGPQFFSAPIKKWEKNYKLFKRKKSVKKFNQ